jgi:hypothetical protein
MLFFNSKGTVTAFFAVARVAKRIYMPMTFYKGLFKFLLLNTGMFL